MMSALRGQHFMKTNLSYFQVLDCPHATLHHNFFRTDFQLRFSPPIKIASNPIDASMSTIAFPRATIGFLYLTLAPYLIPYTTFTRLL
jgi:hypothetical protein